MWPSVPRPKAFYCPVSIEFPQARWTAGKIAVAVWKVAREPLQLSRPEPRLPQWLSKMRYCDNLSLSLPV